jgi:hypothetical protein
MFFVSTPTESSSERSASQIDRVTQRLWRGVEEPVLSVAEGTSAVFILPMLLGAFRPRARTARAPALFQGYEDIHTAIAREKHDPSRVHRHCTDFGTEDDYSA